MPTPGEIIAQQLYETSGVSPSWSEPYTPPRTAPTGLTEGAKKTDEYGTWTVINGVWVLTNPILPGQEGLTDEGESVSPPGSAALGGGGGGEEVTPGALGTMGATPDWGQPDFPVGSPEWWEMVGGARPGYMGALGLLGKEYQSPWQQYMAGQYDPLQMMWQLASPMAMMGYPSMDPGTGMFSQWAPQYAQDPSAMYGMARGMLSNVMGMTPEQRGTLGMGGGGGSFADLLGMGLRSALGPGASWLAGRVPQLQQQWMARDPLGKVGSFIDYIREKYDLGQWL